MGIFYQKITFVNSAQGLACDSTGTMVLLEVPPITGTTTHSGSSPCTSATNVLVLTTSTEVMPIIDFELSQTIFDTTSLANGTRLFTGDVAIAISA